MAPTSENEHRHLEDISSWVLDEQRPVTYKWLAHTLDVNVEQAKRLLRTFCDRKGDSVHVVYLICGRRESTCESFIRLVPQARLQDEKAKFDSVTCEHVFSVHYQPLPDSAGLHAVDLEMNRELYEKRQPSTAAAETRLSAIRPVAVSDAVRAAKEPEPALQPGAPSKPASVAAKKAEPAPAPTPAAKKPESAPAASKPEPAPKPASKPAGKTNPFASASAAASVPAASPAAPPKRAPQEAPKPSPPAAKEVTAVDDDDDEEEEGRRRGPKRLGKRRIVDEDEEESAGPCAAAQVQEPPDESPPKAARKADPEEEPSPPPAAVPPKQREAAEAPQAPQQATVIKEVPKLKQEGKYLVMRAEKEAVPVPAAPAPLKPGPAAARPAGEAKGGKGKGGSKESSDPKKQSSIHSFFAKK
eukprot:tig00020554_g10908.t1